MNESAAEIRDSQGGIMDTVLEQPPADPLAPLPAEPVEPEPNDGEEGEGDGEDE